MSRPLRYALVGDGESPHLLKWARALAPRVDLWAVSSRGWLAEFDACVPRERRLTLGRRTRHGGGNLGAVAALPALARWLAEVDADWINPHYLTSHGSLVWAAGQVARLRGRVVASAWGTDILVTPARHAVYRWLTRKVLQSAALATSDSQHMADAMQALGSREVMVFPFGLERLPEAPGPKDDHLVYANRGLEPIYQPQRVLAAFAAMAAQWPDARLVVANDGSLRAALEAEAAARGLAARVSFVGRLSATEQDAWYRRARWYLSLPESDSTSVSVLEALAHGCLPILSDLPANREVLRDPGHGLLLAGAALPAPQALQGLLDRAEAIAADNRAWVAAHGLFGPAIERLLDRLRALDATRAPGALGA